MEALTRTSRAHVVSLISVNQSPRGSDYKNRAVILSRFLQNYSGG